MGNNGLGSINTYMKIQDIAESVVAFPTKDRKRNVQMDRLRSRSSYYNGKGEPTDKHPDLKPKEPHLKLVKDSEEFPSVKTHSVEELAKKHSVDIMTLRKQLQKGIKIEKEHTTSAKVAKEIALDHLAEYPDYYDRLEKVEESDSDRPYVLYQETVDGEISAAGYNTPDEAIRWAKEQFKDPDVKAVEVEEIAGSFSPQNIIFRLPKETNEAAGVGKITSQNTTVDVKPGETGRQANKFKLNVDSAGTPKLLRP